MDLERGGCGPGVLLYLRLECFKISAFLPEAFTFVKGRENYLISSLGAYQEKIKKKKGSGCYRVWWGQTLNRTSEWPSFQPGSILGDSVSTKSCRHLIKSSHTPGGEKKRLSGGCQAICVKTGKECFKFSGTNQRQRGEKEVYTLPLMGKETQVILWSWWQRKQSWMRHFQQVGKDSPNFKTTPPPSWVKLFLF